MRCEPLNVDLSTAQSATRAALAEVTWPLGYDYSIGGKARQMAEMQGVVKSIPGLAVYFSLIVRAAQFNSLRLPIVILFAAPVWLTGMGYGLSLAGQPFGSTVIRPAMSVLAANVIDGVVLIETAEQPHAEGKPQLAVMANPRGAAKVLVIDGGMEEYARMTMETAGCSGFAHLQRECGLAFEEGARRVTAPASAQSGPGSGLLAI